MARYLLIASRDPFRSTDATEAYALARSLQDAGDDVTLALVENGVLPARPCPAGEQLTALADAGVEVVADMFSLRERGIDAEGLTRGVRAVDLERIVDDLAEGKKAMWF